jgi:hypothetical protein
MLFHENLFHIIPSLTIYPFFITCYPQFIVVSSSSVTTGGRKFFDLTKTFWKDHTYYDEYIE